MQMKWGWVAGGALVVMVGLVAYTTGRHFETPGTTPFWETAAQPLATACAALAALFAGSMAYLNGRQTRIQDADHHRESADRDYESGLRGRYATSAAHLGDNNPAVREAGIYAIAALIDDWGGFGRATNQASKADTEQQVCFNLLCSYLRANRRIASVGEDNSPPPEELAVRSTVLAVFRERLNKWRGEGVRSVDLSGAHLAQADFSGLNLAHANFAGADLTGARFRSANLSQANLLEANIERSDFGLADMYRANMVRVKAREAGFERARMRNVSGYKANFSEGYFEGTSLAGARLQLVRMDEAHVSNVDFTGCVMTGANIANVDLSDSIMSDVDLRRANLLGVQLPPPSHRVGAKLTKVTSNAG